MRANVIFCKIKSWTPYALNLTFMLVFVLAIFKLAHVSFKLKTDGLYCRKSIFN